MNKSLISEMTWLEKIKINEMLRTRLLHFLVEEAFTTISNISLLLERDYSQTYRLCKKMEEEGFLKIHQVMQNINRHISLCGITPKGVEALRNVFFLREGPIKTFQPSKIGSLEQLSHNLKIQKFRAIYTVHQISLGQIPPFMTYVQTEKKPQPDFLIHLSAGKKNIFCVELECTQKSKPRYMQILEGYQNLDVHLLYLFDTEEDLQKIGRVIASCKPKNWRLDNFLLFSTINKVLSPQRRHWEWDDSQYKLHNFLSIVNALDSADIKLNKMQWKSFDFGAHPFYPDSDWADSHPELCGQHDRQGRIVPIISTLESDM